MRILESVNLNDTVILFNDELEGVPEEVVLGVLEGAVRKLGVIVKLHILSGDILNPYTNGIIPLRIAPFTPDGILQGATYASLCDDPGTAWPIDTPGYVSQLVYIGVKSVTPKSFANSVYVIVTPGLEHVLKYWQVDDGVLDGAKCSIKLYLVIMYIFIYIYYKYYLFSRTKIIIIYIGVACSCHYLII